MTDEMIEAIVRVLNDHNDDLTDALRYSINDLSDKLRNAGLIGYSLSEGYSVKVPDAPVAPGCAYSRGHNTPIEHWPM